MVGVDHTDTAALAEPAGDRRLAAADRPGDADADASRAPAPPARARHPRRRPALASTSASSLVTRRSSTKLAATDGSPIASSRWFLRSPSRVSSASSAGPSDAGRHPSTAGRPRRSRASAAAGAAPSARRRGRRRRGVDRCAAPDHARPRTASLRLSPAVRDRGPPRSVAAVERRPPAPSSTTHSRSHTVSSSRRSCDTTSSVAGESRMKASIASRAGMSRWFVGSSSSSRLDGWMPSSASSSRERSPPDSERTSLNDVVAAEQEPREVRARLAGASRGSSRAERRGRSRRRCAAARSWAR